MRDFLFDSALNISERVLPELIGPVFFEELLIWGKFSFAFTIVVLEMTKYLLLVINSK